MHGRRSSGGTSSSRTSNSNSIVKYEYTRMEPVFATANEADHRHQNRQQQDDCSRCTTRSHRSLATSTAATTTAAASASASAVDANNRIRNTNTRNVAGISGGAGGTQTAASRESGESGKESGATITKQAFITDNTDTIVKIASGAERLVSSGKATADTTSSLGASNVNNKWVEEEQAHSATATTPISKQRSIPPSQVAGSTTDSRKNSSQYLRRVIMDEQSAAQIIGASCGGEDNSSKSGGNYRLNISIRDDDDECDCDYGNENRSSKIGSASTTRVIDKERSISTGDSNNFHSAPTIKVTGADAKTTYAHLLVLPLVAEPQGDELRFPAATTTTPSSISSMERRSYDNGSTTPRLRISTPRSSFPPTSADFNAYANSPTAANGKSKESEKKAAPEIRSTPSSRRTVVIIAGLFVVGLILILSGIIVLSVEEHFEFRITGAAFLACGVIFFIICLVLQKKNVKKLVNELEKDLYFLNVTDNKIWNFIFHFDEQLVWS